MITPDNLTVEQIHEVRESTSSESLRRVCDLALDANAPHGAIYARESIAEILNARRAYDATGVTDEQIRELRERLYRGYWAGDHSVWDSINLCRIALVSSSDPLHRDSARKRCAELIQAWDLARAWDARGRR